MNDKKNIANAFDVGAALIKAGIAQKHIQINPDKDKSK